MMPAGLSHTRVSALLVPVLGIAFAGLAQKGTTEAMDLDLAGGVHAHLGPPVVVSTSKVGETRWGRHQFVSISDYPDGKILLRHHDAEDAVSAYGTPMPTYISGDAGNTWEPFKPEGMPPSGMPFPVFEGEFFCLPIARPLDAMAAGLHMPEPVMVSRCYQNWRSYRVDECPKPVQDYMRDYLGFRWSPKRGKWQEEPVTYDTKNALVMSAETSPPTCLLSRAGFERGPILVGKELLFADYRSKFIQDDGCVPKKFAITCMASQDNGKSWMRRSTIALDREGTDSLGEPVLAENTRGELVCVSRRADHEQKSMLITYSADKGNTWDKPMALDQLGGYGVYPALVTLKCGVMVLSYGRPGVRLSFSTDGIGRKWTPPSTIIAGDPDKTWQCTDGYTCMLPIGPNKLLLAYSDFDHRDSEGQQRKAILVRTMTIQRER